jgi:hypothetical protein
MVCKEKRFLHKRWPIETPFDCINTLWLVWLLSSIPRTPVYSRPIPDCGLWVEQIADISFLLLLSTVVDPVCVTCHYM